MRFHVARAHVCKHAACCEGNLVQSPSLTEKKNLDSRRNLVLRKLGDEISSEREAADDAREIPPAIEKRGCFKRACVLASSRNFKPNFFFF